MRSITRILYAGALSAALTPAMLRKLARDGGGALHLAERLGHAPLPDSRPLWINATSVGELGVAARLLAAIRELDDTLPLFLTVSTEPARRISAERTGVDAHALPLDYHGVMRRFFSRLKPRLCIMVEQELWPNLLATCAEEKIPATVVNGRISARSTRRHSYFLRCTGTMFSQLSLVAASTRTDARRFQYLGAKNTVVTGNIKFDAVPNESKVAEGLELRKRLQQQHGSKPVLLLASTRSVQGKNEEELLLDALKPLLDQLIVVLVPRHPHRFDQVSEMLNARGISHGHYSRCGEKDAVAQFVLGDTMGDLDSFIAASDLVFVGASMVNAGCQNLMEAMAQGKPVLVGPHTDNFAALVTKSCRRGAVSKCGSPKDLFEKIKELLADESLRRTMGEAGIKIAHQEGGATEKTVSLLRPLLEKSGLLNS